MPAAPAASLSTRITHHLTARNGAPARAADIASALGVPPDLTPDKWRQKVNNELGRMVRRGVAVRTLGTVEDWAVPVSLFALAPAPTDA